MSELKPCPFCGKEGKVKQEHFTSIEDCKLDYVMCEKCGIYFETYTRDDVDAVTIWNTRPAEDAKCREIDNLKRALQQIVEIANRRGHLTVATWQKDAWYGLAKIAEQALAGVHDTKQKKRNTEDGKFEV